MGSSTYVYIGIYVIAQGDLLDGDKSFEDDFGDWLYENKDESLAEVFNPGDLTDHLEDAHIFIPNHNDKSFGVDIENNGILPPQEVTDIGRQAEFEEVFSKELAEIRRRWKWVQVKHGVMSYLM